ncbi:MAG: ribonuclease III [Caldilineaceae bacterium]|nr:ribonuclease III [Caldilineaceae bacterium]
MIGDKIGKLAQELQLVFQDPELLQRAFMHRSYLNEITEPHTLQDNERLEFLGDAIITFIVSEELFEKYPNYPEGPLTNLRAALVRKETLARLAEQLKLGTYLWLGHGEEESGGRERPATLCAVFEALVGSIYLDQGIHASRNFVLPLMRNELQRVKQNALEKDPKSRLQEWVQSNKGLTPRYRELEKFGPDHAKTFIMQVTIAGETYGVAQGRSKQEATQAAAARALHKLGLPAPEYVPDPELDARFGLTP